MSDVVVPTVREYHAKSLLCGGLCTVAGLGLTVGLLTKIRTITTSSIGKQVAAYMGLATGATLTGWGAYLVGRRGVKVTPVRSEAAHRVYLNLQNAVERQTIEPDLTIPEGECHKEYEDLKSCGSPVLARLQFLCRPPQEPISELEKGEQIKLLGDLWVEFWTWRATEGDGSWFRQKICETDPCCPGRGHSWREHGSDYKFTPLGFLGYLEGRERPIRWGNGRVDYDLKQILVDDEEMTDELVDALLVHFRSVALQLQKSRALSDISEIVVDLSGSGLTDQQITQIEEAFTAPPISQKFQIPVFHTNSTRNGSSNRRTPDASNPFAPRDRRRRSATG